MSLWQPIDTAPHETKILVWDGRAMYVAQLAPAEIDGFVCDLLRGWYVGPESFVGDPSGPQSDPPTHWQALPPPPEAP